MDRLPDRIEADGLVLRRWRADDAEALGRLIADNAEHLRPWMPWMAEEPKTLAERIELIRRWEDEWNAGGDVVLAVLRDGEIAGSCGMHRRIGPDGVELGYWIAAPHTRQGVATAVASALTDAALALPPIDRVEIHHDTNNRASAGIPAKLGFELVGEEPGLRPPAGSGVESVWRTTRPVGPLRPWARVSSSRQRRGA